MTNENSSNELSFDMIAASLRADASDVSTFLDVLGGKLLATLPDNVEVDVPKKKRFFGKSEMEATAFKAESISVKLGDEKFFLKRSKGANFKAFVAQEVRGINLRTDELNLDEWILKLSDALSKEAARSEKARKALGGLVT